MKKNIKIQITVDEKECVINVEHPESPQFNMKWSDLRSDIYRNDILEEIQCILSHLHNIQQMESSEKLQQN